MSFYAKNEKKRGYEIQEYLDEHPEIDNFVIIDDETDMVHLIDKLVQTSWKTGILNEHVERILKILNEGGTENE